MKAEHRKELQTNALADRIGRFFKGMKSKTQATSILVWVVAVLVVIVVAAWFIYRNKSKSNLSQRLVELDRVIDQEQVQPTSQVIRTSDNLEKAEKELKALIEKNSGTETALMARFQLAELHLRLMGLDRLGDRFGGFKPLDNIETAAREYDELADDCKDDPYWEPKALMGAAKATEARAVKNTKYLRQAAEKYAELAQKHPDSAQGKAAAVIAKNLNNKEERAKKEKFYQELGKSLNFDTRK
jgi:hypothetical protein